MIEQRLGDDKGRQAPDRCGDEQGIRPVELLGCKSEFGFALGNSAERLLFVFAGPALIHFERDEGRL